MPALSDPIPAFPLSSPYDEFLKENRWNEYLSNLYEDGLIWFFELQIPNLISHLAPVGSVSGKISIPTRVQLMNESLDPLVSLETFERRYGELFDADDFDGACAAVGAAVNWIWDKGSDFTLFDVWRERIGQILDQESISPLSRSHLYGSKATTEILGTGNLCSAMDCFESGMFWAERASSLSLRFFHMAGIAYIGVYTWDPAKLERYLAVLSPLSMLDKIPLPSYCLYQHSMCFHLTSQKRYDEAIRIMEEIEAGPGFEMIPTSIRLLAHSGHLMAVCVKGDSAQAEKIANIIQAEAVPTENHSFHAAAHLHMGIATLTQNPYKSLLHGNEAVKRARLCKSPYMIRFTSVLPMQALSDLNRLEEASEKLIAYLEDLRSTEYHLMAVTVLFELIQLFLKKGEKNRAKHFYEQLLNMYPKGYLPTTYIPFFRPASFYENIERVFNPATLETTGCVNSDTAYVRIKTFGGLRMHVDKYPVQESMWRGSRTKLLLKALIVYGGTNVPTDVLSSLLWPDMSQDAAGGNLKVTLSRLRRIVAGPNKKPLFWIEMKNKRISLDKSSCYVDAIRFEESILEAMAKPADIEILSKALDLYTDDFLVRDINEEWIISHRLHLRDLLIKGVTALHDRCQKEGMPELALPYLRHALDKAPLAENLYARIMRIYMDKGCRSDALSVLKRAKERFERELGVEPGPEIAGLAKMLS